MKVATDQFKKGMARWASGVTIVTTHTKAGPAGLTASAFSSVAAEPPLVLVCVNMTAQSCARISEAGFFAVNILAASQRAVSDKFASPKGKNQRFDGLAWHPGTTGAPLLEGCLASLDCALAHTVEMGTHRVFFGEVHQVVLGKGKPLLYYDGDYRE